MEKLQQHAPDIDGRILKEAVDWSSTRMKSRKIPVHRDEFSDPLLIADKLIDYAGNKIDSTTLVAAIIYPSVRPKPGSLIDGSGMRDIESKFGHKVHELVKRTLQFRALDRLDLEPGALKNLPALSNEKPASEVSEEARILQRQKQRHEEHVRDFRLMSLWVAQDPRAILIRATQFAINLDEQGQKAIDRVGTRQVNDAFSTRASDADYVQKAREVMAPLAYISGYSDLRNDILNGALRILSPQVYALTSRQIATAERLNGMGAKKPENGNGNTCIKEDDLPHFKKHIEAALSSVGLGSDQYMLEVRRKEAFSAHSKAERKQQDVGQLGDRLGFRIVLKPTAITGHDSKDEETLHKELGDLCHRVYAHLSKELGRGHIKRDSRYDEKFKELALIDPDPNKPGHDARFDDYIRKPKESGYSAIQDTFYIPHKNGTLVEFEGQIVDERRHMVNSFDPKAGHTVYKSGMDGKGELLQEWKRSADEIQSGASARHKSVFVYGANNEIHLVDDATLGRYVSKLHGKDALKTHDVVAQIDNVDPFIPRERTLRSPDALLRNGDRIYALELVPR